MRHRGQLVCRNYAANMSSSALAGELSLRDAERMRTLPSPSEVAAATPAGRDRSLDFIRLTSLLVVITGHGVMLMVTVTPGHLEFGNLLAGSVGLQALTWLLQVLAASLGALLLARVIARPRVSQFVRTLPPSAYKLANSRGACPAPSSS